MTRRKVDPIEVVRAGEAEIGVQILPREKRRRQTSAHGLARRIAAWIMRRHLGLNNVLSRLGVKCNHGVEDDAVLQIQPRTPIAEALLRARRAYLEAGGKLLDWNELEDFTTHHHQR